MVRFIKQYLPSIAVCTAVLVLSTINTGVLPKVDAPNSDKLVHAVMYFGVVLSLLLDSTHYLTIKITKRFTLFITLFAIVFGAVMEGIQGMLPWRSASLFDILANSMGALFGLGLFSLISKFYHK